MPRSEEEIIAELQSLIGSQMSNQAQPSMPLVLRPTGKETTARGTTNEVTFVPDYKQQQDLDLAKKEKEEEINRVYKARTNLDEYTSDAMQSLIALDKIEKQSKKLGDFGRGMISQTYARIKTGIADYSKDRDITRYLGVVSQELIPMARKLMEEKGPITEWDVDRVEKSLGNLTTPLEDKIYLLNEFRNKIKLALKNKMQVAQIPEKDFANRYTDLYEKVFSQPNINDSSNNSNDLANQARAILAKRASSGK